MKSVNSNIEKIKNHLSDGKMFDAMSLMLSCASAVSEYTKTLVYPGIKEAVEAVKEDYERMLLFFSDGMRDPEREAIYNRYSKNLLKIARKMELMYLINTYSVYSAAYKRTSNFNPALIQEKLASLSESIKVLEEGEEEKADELKAAYKQKADYDNLLFSYILVSPQWSEYETDYFSELIISGKADSVTASLMTTAIMVSCMGIYDFQKLRCLVAIYQQAEDVNVKERALVGLVLCLKGALKSEKDLQKDLIGKLCEEKPEAVAEIAELQKQIICSLDTKKKNEEFQEGMDKLIKAAIPTEKLMKDDWDSSDAEEGSLFEDEEKMEMADKYFNKMREMEQSGFDIYFDGFSKMKNFAFFHTFSNWFVPYYYENPSLHSSQSLLDESTMAMIDKMLTSRAHICDSDKYSMAYAIGVTMKHAPEINTMLSQMEESDKFSSHEKIDVKLEPSVVRRQYLQSLYRFFKLCTMNTYLDDPFDEKDNQAITYFLCRREFDTEVFEKVKLSLCRYLTKQKDYGRLGEILCACRQTNQVDYMMMMALYDFHYKHDYSSALHCITSVLMKAPNNIPALKLMGRCYYRMGSYDEAANVYERLIEIGKNKDSYKVKLACCLLENGELNEGIQLLFEQEYHHPDQKDILRALAWGLLQRGQLEKSLDYYTRLIRVTADEKGEGRADDLYHIGLVCFCSHDIKQAIVYFTQFLQFAQVEDFVEKLSEDETFMAKFDISPVDIKLMEDAVKLSYNHKRSE